MERRERQGRLGLEPLGAQNRRAPRLVHELIQQGRLPRARLPSYDQAASQPLSRTLDEPDQGPQLLLAADQHALNVHARGPTEPIETWRFDRGDAVPAQRGLGPCRSAHALARGRPTQCRRQEAPPCKTPPPPTPWATARDVSAGQRRHIGLLLFDGVEELDAVGPWEVLSHWTQQPSRGRLGRLLPVGRR